MYLIICYFDLFETDYKISSIVKWMDLGGNDNPNPGLSQQNNNILSTGAEPQPHKSTLIIKHFYIDF